MIFKSAGTVPEQLQAKVTTHDKVGNGDPRLGARLPAVCRPGHADPRERRAAFDKVVPQIMTKQLSLADGMSQIQDAQNKSTPIPTK